MKIRLSMPSTTSMAISVASAAQAVGSAASVISWSSKGRLRGWAVVGCVRRICGVGGKRQPRRHSPHTAWPSRGSAGGHSTCRIDSCAAVAQTGLPFKVEIASPRTSRRGAVSWQVAGTDDLVTIIVMRRGPASGQPLSSRSTPWQSRSRSPASAASAATCCAPSPRPSASDLAGRRHQRPVLGQGQRAPAASTTACTAASRARSRSTATRIDVGLGPDQGAGRARSQEAALEGARHRHRHGVHGHLHRQGEGGGASRGRRQARAGLGAVEGRRPHRRLRRQPRQAQGRAQGGLQRLLHHQLPGAGRQGAERPGRHQVGLHDHHPRLHQRPERARPGAQGHAPRPRRRRQHDPDLDRCRRRRRPGAAGAQGQARRHRHPRADAQRVGGRPEVHPRPRDQRGRDQQGHGACRASSS